jgi:hypothetical protein
MKAIILVCCAVLLLAAVSDAARHRNIKAAPIVHFGESARCDLCKFVISKFESLITKDTTIQDLIDFADKYVCPLVPDEQDRTVCPQMVAEMAPIIIESVINKENPAVVCAAVEQCPKPTGLKNVPHTERRHATFA